MATKLEKPLKREIEVAGKPYMLTIAPEALKLVPKGKRNGHELTWDAIVRSAWAATIARWCALPFTRTTRVLLQ